jgi:cytochrome c biogenesis protein CcdA
MAIGGTALAFIAGVPVGVVALRLADPSDRSGRGSLETQTCPMALAAGLSVSFVTVGLFVATIGHAIGLSGDALRAVAAVLIVAIGAVSDAAPVAGPAGRRQRAIAAWTDQRFGQSQGNRLSSQFWIGAC